MRRNIILCFLVILVFSLFLAAQAIVVNGKQEKNRVALVIGNSEYIFPNKKLLYAESDARNIAKALENLDFEVIFVPNATRKVFREKITEWEEKLKQGGVALFFYTGHGVQVDGINFLIPIDAQILKENEMKYTGGIDVNQILDKIKDAKCKTNIVVLDACRVDPFEGFKVSKSGFAYITNCPETIIAFSTIPGRTSRDTESYSSFFHNQLVHNPKLEIKNFFNEVRYFVMKNTGGEQVPYETNMLSHDFYFTKAYDSDPKEPPPSKKDIFLRSNDVGKQEIKWVKNAILKWKFFDLCWHPKKEFRNSFEKHKKKKTFVIIDTYTKLMWCKGGSKPKAHKDAEAWIEKLNEEDGFAGFRDWRLPTIEEAASLIENSKKGKLNINDKFSSRQKKIWTLDQAPYETLNNVFLTLYWAVDFTNGIVARYDEESLLSARPVRSMR